MSHFWSSIVHDLTPYVPGEQPKLDNLIKLNTNENPYGASPAALAALKAEIMGDTLRLYPDPNADLLKDAIANYYGVATKQVFVGNGSDEVLAHTFQALLKHSQPLLFPDISYSFYPVYCRLYDVSYNTVALTNTFEIALDHYTVPNGGIIFSNPNAPTGCLLSLANISALLERNTESVVVVDEAYIDFGGESAIALVNQYPNLLVIQTFSKSRSLAGLRVGFAIGDAALIEALERVKNSFNSYPLGRLSIVGAVAALQDQAFFEKNRQRIIQSRESLVAGLGQLGFEVLPSMANFVFARHKHEEAESLALQLRQRAIIVRHFSQPRIKSFLRITVGTDPHCDALLQVLADILGKGSESKLDCE